MEQAVEELLRYAGPVRILSRTATAEIDLNGAFIGRGERIILRVVAANRDPERFSHPNQVDLARTWMDFTVTSLRAEEAMGFGLTTSETATLYRYWWLLGHLLGIDARLIAGISTNDQARRVDWLLQAVTGPLIPESAVLATALGTMAARCPSRHSNSLPSKRATSMNWQGGTLSCPKWQTIIMRRGPHSSGGVWIVFKTIIPICCT